MDSNTHGEEDYYDPTQKAQTSSGTGDTTQYGSRSPYPPPPPPYSYSPYTLPPDNRRPKRNLPMYGLLGIIGLLLVIVIVLLLRQQLVLSSSNPVAGTSPTVAPTATPTPSPTPTPTPSQVPSPTATPAPTSSFPTDPGSAAKYLGITTGEASFRSIPDGAGPTTLIGWQISANQDITVTIGSNICIDFVKDPNGTHVVSGTFTDLSATRIRSTSQVQIFLPSGQQLSFYKTAC